MHCIVQVVGNDLHLTAIVGAKQLKTDGAEYNIEAGWVDHTPKPHKSRNIGTRTPNIPIVQGHISFIKCGKAATMAVFGPLHNAHCLQRQKYLQQILASRTAGTGN